MSNSRLTSLSLSLSLPPPSIYSSRSTSPRPITLILRSSPFSSPPFSLLPHSPQHGIQLQQNYEDMKAEMPWLQLEDENLDILAKNVPKSKPRESRTTDAEPVVMLVSECMCVCVCAHACMSGRGGTSLVKEGGWRKGGEEI